MLLEAAQDIRAAERDLREIELLKTRGVEGSGTVEGPFAGTGPVHFTIKPDGTIDLLPLRPNLMHGIKRNRERSKELELSRKKVSDLLIRYNEFVRLPAQVECTELTGRSRPTRYLSCLSLCIVGWKGSRRM